MRRYSYVRGLVVAAAIAIAGCGGGGGAGDGGSSNTPNAAVGGIWEGTATIAGQGTVDLIGLIAEDGRAHFIQLDGVQYWGTVRSTGNDVTANFDGAVEIGSTFVDGSTSGTGSFSGTVASRSRLNGTVTFTTSRGSRFTSTVTMQYNSLYDRDSSLATVAGNYTSAAAPGSDAINISSNGELFGQVPSNGCVINGTVSVVNPAYNAYGVQYSYSSCTGVDSVLNGSTFSGIATLDNTSAPETAIAGMQGRVAGALYSLVFAYHRT